MNQKGQSGSDWLLLLFGAILVAAIAICLFSIIPNEKELNETPIEFCNSYGLNFDKPSYSCYKVKNEAIIFHEIIRIDGRLYIKMKEMVVE